jgi:hypothetical protein
MLLLTLGLRGCTAGRLISLLLTDVLQRWAMISYIPSWLSSLSAKRNAKPMALSMSR